MKIINKLSFIYFLIIFLIFFYNNIENVNSQSSSLQPVPEQYDCLKNIVVKFALNSKFPLNTTGGYDNFCGSNSAITCNVNGTIKIITLQAEPTTMNDIQATYTDFVCLPNLVNLNLDRFNISDDLLYTKLQNVNSLNIGTSTISSITAEIPYESFSIKSNSLSGIIKMSYFNKQTTTEIVSLSKDGIKIEADASAVSIENRIFSISNALNIPDLTGFNLFRSLTIIVYLNTWDVTTISNVPTIQAISLILSIGGKTSPSFQFPSSFYFFIEKIVILGNFIKPSNPVDLRAYTKLSSFEISDVGGLFHINNEIPLILLPTTSLIFNQGNITKFPIGSTSFMNISHTESYQVYLSNLAGNLPPFTGVEPLYYKFSNNKITGTLDSSWCNAQIDVNTNLMTGELPSCITCHLGSAEVAERFIGNQFTNYSPIPPCTTFKPRIDFDPINLEMTLTGNDIGNEFPLWTQESFISCSSSSWKKVIYGKKYVCPLNYPIGQSKYFWMNFPTPGVNYTFPLYMNQPSIPTSIILNALSNEITISGTFFSTYIDYLPQSFTFNGISCNLVSSSFYSVVCKLDSSTSSSSIIGSNSVLTQLNVNALKTIVLVNLIDGYDNNKVCENGCVNGICNLATGLCECTPLVWSGLNCTIPYQYITAVIPSTTDGGNASFIGYFGNVHTGLSITIDGKNCPITFNSSNEIHCNAPPGTAGIKPMTLFQNDIEFKYTYQYIEIIKSCPLNCSNNGKCNTTNGQCQCNKGYTSYDCSVSTDTTTTPPPPTNTTVDPTTGGTEITNQEIQFSIYFKSLIEIDINGNIIKEIPLLNNWKINQTTSNQHQYSFIQTINQDDNNNNNNCTIKTEIEEIIDPDGKEYEFAKSTFKLEKGSIKFSISILNYKYLNNLNTLKLEMVSMVKENEINSNNDCNSKDTEINDLQDLSTFNYIKISKNNKVLTGRFISKLLSDGIPTYLKTSLSKQDDNSIIVSLELPHCQVCEIDPDFSVLIDPSFKVCNNSSSRKWVIPVAVVVSVVGVSIIVIIAFILYKRHNIHIRVGVAQLKNLNK